MDSIIRPRAVKHDLEQAHVLELWKQAKKLAEKKKYKVGGPKYYAYAFRELDKKCEAAAAAKLALAEGDKKVANGKSKNVEQSPPAPESAS